MEAITRVLTTRCSRSNSGLFQGPPKRLRLNCGVSGVALVSAVLLSKLRHGRGPSPQEALPPQGPSSLSAQESIVPARFYGDGLRVLGRP
jgi:hypothetical protein